MRVALNGCFDVLTPGHFNILMFARGIADKNGRGKVIVLLDEDDLITATKGLDRPIFNIHERAKSILDLRMPDGTHVVDEIEFFSTNLHLEMMYKRLRPDVIVKGSDWEGKKVIGSDVSRIVFYKRLDDHSTTNLIAKLRKP
jgi:cytidyltransferase-like protein